MEKTNFLQTVRTCEHFRRREVSRFRCRHGLTTPTPWFAKGRICAENSFKPLSVRAVGFHFQVPVGDFASSLARTTEDPRSLNQPATRARRSWVVTMASAADPLLVLYGSETGNARDVAERIAREAARGGDDAGPVHCLSMDRFEVTQLPTAPLVVCVCSTTGQGDPPANMRDFWRFLLRKSLPADSLNAVRFAVFGLGDLHYQKYNVAAKRLHRRLLALGARELLDLGLGDDQHPTGYEATLDPWLERLWRALGRTVGPATSAHHQSESRACADPCRVVVRVVEAPEGVG